jgi:hypothetical protein
MDSTAHGTDAVRASAALQRADDRRVRPERAVRLRRVPTFVLTWLDVPNDGSDPALPLGTCLVLRSVGGQTPRDVVVELPGGVARRTDALRRRSTMGVATPTEIGTLAELGTLFVEWTSSDGVRRTTWLRVPTVPARYRVRRSA